MHPAHLDHCPPHPSSHPFTCHPQEFRGTVVAAILATDMSRHVQGLKELQGRDALSLESLEDRRLFASSLLHAADVSNPVRGEVGCRGAGGVCACDSFPHHTTPHHLPPTLKALPWFVARVHAELVSTEFRFQVRQERQLGLPVTAFMDLADVRAVAKLNIGFVDFVVAPLFAAVHEVRREAGWGWGAGAGAEDGWRRREATGRPPRTHTTPVRA